jgi:dTDP-4-dehydrorhamnose 3,5-epimerase
MIKGVNVKKLKIIPDDRGRLMEIMRVSQTSVQPKQVYLTTAYENIVKDKTHFCCIKGTMKLVLVDTRADSVTKGEINEFEIGEENPCLVTIPNNVLHAFKSMKGEAFVVNCINYEYDKDHPDEYRIENKYYDWDKMCPV